MIKKLISYFFQGLLLIVPVVGTAYLLFILFVFLDELIPVKWFPGSGIIILFIAVAALGFLGNTLIASPIRAGWNSLIGKAPLIKTIYRSLVDLMSAFVGQKRKFDHAVLVRLSKESNIQKLGFVTSTDLSMLGLKEGKIAVYLPHSYAFSGNLFIVDIENVETLNTKPADVMKFIVSGGLTTVEKNNERE